MASLGYKYVTADQLVAGPWPNNSPAVGALDWDTGEPNAKYWAVRMIAAGLGSGRKALYHTVLAGSAGQGHDAPSLFAQGIGARGARMVLLVSKTEAPQT